MIKFYPTENQRDNTPEAKRFYFKAQDALRSGKLVKAIQYLKRSLEIKDDYQPSCRELAEIYHQHGNLDEAEKYIRRSLQINPNDPVSLFVQGVIHITKGEIQTALRFFNKVLEHGELTWGLAYNLGLCYYGLKDFDASIQYLNQAIQKDPSQVQSYLLLAQVYIVQNKMDMAKELLVQAKKMRPMDPQIDVWLSNLMKPQKYPKG
jgi:tetratricopeptide (TPR) repeat protein